MRRVQTTPALVAGAILLALGVGFALLALQQLRSTVERLDRVISVHAQAVILVERLRGASERIGRTTRSYLLTADEQFLDEIHEARAGFSSIRIELVRLHDDPRLRDALRVVEELERRHRLAVDRLLRPEAKLDRAEALSLLAGEIQPLREGLDRALFELARHENEQFEAARDGARHAASSAVQFLVVVAGAALIAAGVLLFGIARVLGALARSRSELQASHDRLELVNHDLDAFAGRIAHDLRGVLAPLPMLAARLARSGERQVGEDIARRLAKLSDRSEQMIESLLAFARGGHSADARCSASVRVAAAQAGDDLTPLTVEVGATIRLDVEDVAVRCPPGLLHTVLLNLMGNALKFVAGRPRRDVSVTARRLASGCEIAVSDTGPGIPEDWRTKVFAPFARVPGTTAAGSGIGLATVHRIVRAHGGDVQVRPQEQEGTTFVVTLPCADETPRSAREIAAPSRAN